MTKYVFLLCTLLVLAVTACTNQAQPQQGVDIETPSAAPISPVIPAAISQSPESPLSEPTQENTQENTEENIESLLSENEHLTHVSDLVSYPEIPPYEVWYDAEIWQFTEDDEPGLVNLEDSNCYLSLRNAPGGAEPVDAISLAGRVWTIFGGTDENGEPASSIVYSTQAGDGGYLFRIDLPEPYQEGEKSICEQLAEEVIDTFRVMD